MFNILLSGLILSTSEHLKTILVFHERNIFSVTLRDEKSIFSFLFSSLFACMFYIFSLLYIPHHDTRSSPLQRFSWMFSRVEGRKKAKKAIVLHNALFKIHSGAELCKETPRKRGKTYLHKSPSSKLKNLKWKLVFKKIHSIMKLGLIRKPALQPKIIQFV